MRLIEVKKNGEWALKGVEQEALCAGKVITEELRQKLYGALCKLRDYENTGLSPEDVERVNNFGESQVERLMKKLQEEQEKHRWIPVGERLPEFGEYVMISFSNFSISENLSRSEPSTNSTTISSVSSIFSLLKISW